MSPSMEPLERRWPLAGEAYRKAEEKNGHLMDERLALIMEL